MKSCLVLLFVIGLSLVNLSAQESYVAENETLSVTEKQCRNFAKRTQKKCDRLTAKLKKNNDLALIKLQHAENRVFQSLCEVNERQAEGLMRNAVYSNRYLADQIKLNGEDKLNNPVDHVNRLDEISSLFGDSSNDSIPLCKTLCKCEGVADMKTAQENLKKELKRTELIADYINSRNAYLHKVACGKPNIISSLANAEKLAYYNDQQINDYLQIFSSQSKMEALFSGIVQSILKQNAVQPAGILKSTTLSGSLSNQIPEGVQTKEEVFALISEAMDHNKLSDDLIDGLPKELGIQLPDANTPESSLSTLQETKDLTLQKRKEITDLTSEIHNTKEKSNQQADKTWKPNPLKTKRFVDRLKFGFSMQADPPTKYFPTSARLLGQVGYQIRTNMSVGLGTSLNIAYLKKSTPDVKGIGTFGYDGYSIRSFYDFKIKGNIYFQMNYEWNFRESNQTFSKVQYIPDPIFRGSLQGYESWLGGLKIKGKSLKGRSKTIEILYDFKHKSTGQTPLVVRFGFDLNSKHAFKN